MKEDYTHWFMLIVGLLAANGLINSLMARNNFEALRARIERIDCCHEPVEAPSP